MKLKDYLSNAQKNRWAIGQFNFSTLEQLKAIINACRKLNSPAIVGTSEGGSGFVGLSQAAALVASYRKDKGLAVFLNLDHGKSFDYIKEAIDAGYDAVHFDGSKLGLEENIDILIKVKDYARKRDVVVEGEINTTPGASKLLKEAPSVGSLTDPEQALEFTKRSKPDTLAVNVGSFHGIVEPSLGGPVIDFDRLEKIQQKVKIPLVLHGGSGVSDNDIKKAVSLGIVKINVNTELRLAYTNTLRQALKNNPEETTPYKLLPEVVAAIQGVVEKKIKLFGSDNKT